jgi:hypothetical protein
MISFLMLMDSNNFPTYAQEGFHNFASAHLIIYKTKNNYFNLVPITLSADKKQIVSFPAPGDLIINNRLCLPEKLKNGFLLDNRGITIHTGFINISYLEYANLSKTPDVNYLQELMLDNDPICELYDCGLRSDFKNIKKEINKVIKNNNLNKYSRLK